MSNESEKPSARLADRLKAAQRRNFVGRQGERASFEAALLATTPLFAILHVYGPGGIGKTSLLRAFQHIATEQGCFTLSLDGRNISPSPAGFWRFLQFSLGLQEDQDPLEFLASTERPVLFIDTYELLRPLDGWLRTDLLPLLPERCIVVIAGRDSPDPAWRTQAWRDLTHIMALRNLKPEEGRVYLRNRGIAKDQQGAVLAFTHSHPLALSLVADAVLQGSFTFSPEHEVELIRILLEHFVQQVPSPQHRHALEICAHTRVTSEALLESVFGHEAGQELFVWLAGLSFIQHGEDGLFPHDLARDVLDYDLRWRNRETYTHIHQQVRRHIVNRLQKSETQATQQRAFWDLLYLHRHSPVMKPYYAWSSLGTCYTRPANHSDLEIMLDIADKNYGKEGLEIVRHWWKTQPEAFAVFCESTGEMMGFYCTLLLHKTSPQQRAADPAVAHIWAMMEASRLQPHEAVLVHRLIAGLRTEDPQFNALTSLSSTQSWLMTENLAWSFVCPKDPHYWHDMFIYLNFKRLPELDHQIDQQQIWVYGHDWRAENSLTWMDNMAQRELASSREAALATPRITVHNQALSRPEFEESVRRALRDLHDPLALQQNALLQARLLRAGMDVQNQPESLRRIIHDALELIRQHPKRQKFYRALYHTYIDPAPTQESAAELLDLPFNTYRYHLGKGLYHLLEILWQQETRTTG